MQERRDGLTRDQRSETMDVETVARIAVLMEEEGCRRRGRECRGGGGSRCGKMAICGCGHLPSPHAGGDGCSVETVKAVGEIDSRYEVWVTRRDGGRTAPLTSPPSTRAAILPPLSQVPVN